MKCSVTQCTRPAVIEIRIGKKHILGYCQYHKHGIINWIKEDYLTHPLSLGWNI